MRRANCQDYRFHRTETYPSIRPQVSRCDPSKAQAIAWLANSLEADGCGRTFDMEQDDVQFFWQHIPRKDTLRFYGVGSPNDHQPESVMFNQALMVSLKKASVDGTKRRSKRPSPPPSSKKTPNLEDTVDNQMCQPYILNRQALQKELEQMPIVQQRLNPRSVLESVFCRHPVDSNDPFGVAQHENNIVTRAQALDMELPPKKKPHGLRRRHWYCPPVESSIGGEQNACSQYECAKYKLEPTTKEYQQWLHEQNQEIMNPEPKDYEQLYTRFLKCFEQEPSRDPICKLYEICCGKKKSHGDEGRGGGDGQAGGDNGADWETEDQDKGRDWNKNRKNFDNRNKQFSENNKNTDRDKDKDKDKKKGKEKVTDKTEDKDTDKDTDQDKNKDAKVDKKKNKTKSSRGSKDSGKAYLNKNLDKYLDKDDDNKKKKRKPSMESVRNPPTEIPELPEKRKSWSDDDDQNKRASYRKKTSLIDQTLTNDITAAENDENDNRSEKHKKIGPEKYKHSRHKDKPKNKDKPENQGKSQKENICPVCPPIGCPCEICSYMSHRVSDAPFIKDMMRAEKKRQLQEYYRQMQHREYLSKCRREEVRPAFHKCDPISCNNFFCQNPNFGKHCDCLGAVQDLQKLLTGCQDKGIDQKLLQRVEQLRQRINRRMCDCVLT
ncbi:hypothetical protein KR032_000022 [Drosophila birchii]|nr:hypothetical protein KR032_000022 [Drosophila birchii]